MINFWEVMDEFAQGKEHKHDNGLLDKLFQHAPWFHHMHHDEPKQLIVTKNRRIGFNAQGADHDHGPSADCCTPRCSLHVQHAQMLQLLYEHDELPRLWCVLLDMRSVNHRYTGPGTFQCYVRISFSSVWLVLKGP